MACGGDRVAPPVAPVVEPARLVVEVRGLPTGEAANARETLRAAGLGARLRGRRHSDGASIDTLLLDDATFLDLAPGSVSVSSSPGTAFDVRWTGTPAEQELLLESAALHTTRISYTAATGTLRLEPVGELPGTDTLRVTIATPAGLVDTVTLPTRRTGLAPGAHVVRVLPLLSEGALHRPQRPVDTVHVEAGLAETVLVLPIERQLAELRLAAPALRAGDGLLRGRVLGPGDEQQSLLLGTTPVLFTGLSAGTYRIVVDTLETTTARLVPQRSVDTIPLAAGARRDHDLLLRREQAALEVAVRGLPAGRAPDLRVSGPFGFARTLQTDALLDTLRPGTYTVAVHPVLALEHTWRGEPNSLVRTVGFGDTARVAVEYTLATGGIAVVLRGFPESTAPPVVIRGPDGTTTPAWTPTQSETRRNLPPGRYTLTADTRLVNGIRYVPNIAQRFLQVVPSLVPDTVEVTWDAVTGPSLDFAISAAYLTQATQRLDGSVPLVEGRDALLRVFVTANEGNNEQLPVRVQLRQGGAPYRTLTLASPGNSVPLGVDEGSLGQTWNAIVAGGDVRAGMTIVAEFDAEVGDANLANNRFPVAGEQVVPVQPVPAFSLVLVPIVHPIDGLTGNVTPANADALTALARAVLPLGSVSVQVRAPFTTAAPALRPGDDNNGWLTVLNEMRLLQLTDPNMNAHYMGIVGTTYTSGIAGIATIGDRHAVTWDKPTSAARVLAHELGHNFGRFHSPGCGASFIDPQYPYGGGAIGTWGWNGTTVVSPSVNDIMGYCAVQWVSDYTWRGVLTFRANSGAVVLPSWLPTSTRPETMLLVAGAIRTGASHADLSGAAGRSAESSAVSSAEATFAPPRLAVARAAWPRVGSGRYTLELLDAGGNVVRTLRFDGEPVDHRTNVVTVGAAIPLSGLAATPDAVRVRSGSVTLGAWSVVR